MKSGRRIGWTACVVIVFWINILIGCKNDSLRLSSEDRQAIAVLVQKENAGKIENWENDREGTDCIIVHTRNPNGNGGSIFTLKKTLKGWVVVSRGAWMN